MTPSKDQLGILPDYIASIHVYERNGAFYATEKNADTAPVVEGTSVNEALIRYVNTVTEGEAA
jgi:hypothetical protein